VDHATVRKAFDIVGSDEESTWRQLRAAKTLSSEVREDIFLAALGLAKADLDFHQNESALLVRIGESLGLPQTRIDDLCGSEMELWTACEEIEPAPYRQGDSSQTVTTMHAVAQAATYDPDGYSQCQRHRH